MHICKTALCRLLVATGVMSVAMTGYGFEAKDIMAFKAGPFLFRPHLLVAEQYSDNVFYQSRGEPIDDFITIISPSIGVQVGRSGSRVSLDASYVYSQMFYAQNPYVDDTSQHRITLGGGLSGTKLRFDLTGSLSWANTIYGGYEAFEWGGVIFLVRAPTTERVSYNLSPKINYIISEKTSINGGVSFSGTDFLEKSSYYDSDYWRATIGVAYKVRPKMSLLGDLFYGQSASTPNEPPFGTSPRPKSPHVETVGGFIGVRAELSPRFDGTAKVGYQESSQAGRSQGAPSYEGSLAWQASEKSNLSIKYGRRSSSSVWYSSIYTSDTVTLNFSQMLGTKRPWLLSAGATYGHGSYADDRSQSRDYLGANIDIAYRIKLWLVAGLGYEFTKSIVESKSSIDYEVNRVTLTVSIGY